MAPSTHSIPADGDGNGTARVTVPPSGDIKVIYHLKGRTKDKTPIEATVSCATLIDFGG